MLSYMNAWRGSSTALTVRAVPEDPSSFRGRRPALLTADKIFDEWIRVPIDMDDSINISAHISRYFCGPLIYTSICMTPAIIDERRPLQCNVHLGARAHIYVVQKINPFLLVGLSK